MSDEKRHKSRATNLSMQNDIMDEEYNDCGENAVADMMADYDCHINTSEQLELFDESSVDDFIANLNDWD